MKLSKIWCKSSTHLNKPVREGERRSRHMLGLSPEFQAGDLPIRIRCAKILVQSFEPVPMVEATSLELPRDSQKAEVGTPIVHIPAVDSLL